jgi:hypothetical protein
MSSDLLHAIGVAGRDGDGEACVREARLAEGEACELGVVRSNCDLNHLQILAECQIETSTGSGKVNLSAGCNFNSSSRALCVAREE